MDLPDVRLPLWILHMFGCPKGPSECSVAHWAPPIFRLHFRFLGLTKMNLAWPEPKSSNSIKGCNRKSVVFWHRPRILQSTLSGLSLRSCSVVRLALADVRLPLWTLYLFGCLLGPSCGYFARMRLILWGICRQNHRLSVLDSCMLAPVQNNTNWL